VRPSPRIIRHEPTGTILAALSTAIRATSRALPRAFPRAILNNRLPQGTRWNFLRPFPIDSKVI